MLSRRATRLSLLRLFRLLCPAPRVPNSLGGRAAKILIIRPDHLGDILFATPALALLRRALPDAEITAMVGPWAESLLRPNPDLDRLIICPFPGFERRPKTSLFAPYRLLWQEARRLRTGHYDLALNLRFDFWWGALLSYYAGIPHRLGYDLPETRPFLSRVLPYQPGRHEVLQNVALVKDLPALGARATRPRMAGDPSEKDAPPEDLPLRFETTVEDDVFASQWCKGNGLNGPFCVIHPGAGAAVKLWTPEGFAAVADALGAQFGLKMVVSGTEAEQPLVEAIGRQMCQPPAMLIGFALGQVGAVLRQSRLAIGPDSGIMHLAVALGVPSVHLYGPVDDATFGPWGDRGRHVVVKSDRPCIPCNKLDYRPSELDQHPCVHQITPRQVLAAAEQVLERSVAG